ncbi:WXG100 family type VII secretion target [Nocardia arizonensis]|uniref:WXG100 family type VII secretion target n=1 Tax=Nocardia arizonensis TaxID=1141647 RepID=UPI00138F3EA8|nr:WXG100 family type VII secretion target [Nocardia arizonensis]
MANDQRTTGDFGLVPEEVTDAGVFVQQVAESLVNGLNSLDADIANLMNGWRGTSADAFSAGWSETKQGADSILDALTTMAELLGVTSRVLEDHDKARATATATLPSSLDLPAL